MANDCLAVVVHGYGGDPTLRAGAVSDDEPTAFRALTSDGEEGVRDKELVGPSLVDDCRRVFDTKRNVILRDGVQQLVDGVGFFLPFDGFRR
jgi:hypothetical protein